MKAVVKSNPQPGIELRDVPTPTLRDDEVLVEVKAAGICGSDVHMNAWVGHGYHWITLPLVMGHEFAGSVVEIGAAVRDLRVGDRVAVTPHVYCGACVFCRSGRFNLCLRRALSIGFTRDGGFAEYAAVPAASVFALPATLSYELGALLEPLCVALHGHELARPEPGGTVAILGPGPIGLLAVQVARATGAGTIVVTGLARDRARLAMARALGADVTVDVEADDPLEVVRNATSSIGVDVVYELSGNPVAFRQGLSMLRRGGRMVLIGLTTDAGAISPIADMVRSEKTILGSFNYLPTTWMHAITLLDAKRVNPERLITHRLPLEAAHDGFALAERGEALKILLRP